MFWLITATVVNSRYGAEPFETNVLCCSENFEYRKVLFNQYLEQKKFVLLFDEHSKLDYNEYLKLKNYIPNIYENKIFVRNYIRRKTYGKVQNNKRKNQL